MEKNTRNSLDARKRAMYEAAMKDPDLKGFSKKKRWVLFCLKVSKGIISNALKLSGISRQTYYDWYQEYKDKAKKIPNNSFDPDFKEMADEIRLITHEWVESKLLENIENNDQKAIEFYLANNYREKYSSLNQKVDVTTNGESLNKSFYDFLKEVSVIDNTKDEDGGSS